MTALWAPILLVHLGGPDTITGYSLEDNELWLRHFLSMIGQFGVAIYVLWKSRNTSPLNFIAFPVFVAALVKCGERTWALMSASREYFRDWVLCNLFTGPSYSKFMDEPWTPDDLQLPHKVTDNIQDAQLVYDAYHLFTVLKLLVAELIPIFKDQNNSLDYLTERLWDQACKVPTLEDDNSRKLYQARAAFRIIEVELGFMYDLLHTKTTLVYTHWRSGASFRVVKIISTIPAFIAFCIIDKRKYFRIEVLITYVLLAVAIALELYTVIVLLSSDAAILWICEHKKMGPDRVKLWIGKLHMMMDIQIYKIISVLRRCHIVPANKRWSNDLSQLNLISIFPEEKPALWPGFQKKVHIYELREMQRYVYEEDISDSLKLLIYDRLKEEATSNCGIWIHRGNPVQGGMRILESVKFDQRILLWHIATTLCYYDPDYDRDNKDISESEPRVMSMKLSNYMMYLLIKSPFMMPNGIGHIRYRDTRAEASWLFNPKETREAACKNFLAEKTDILLSKVKGDRRMSVLFDARRLAKSLRHPERETYKWDVISRAWVTMLAYAASRCTWNNHAKKLTEGGDLLTHVWLLMAHLGITDHTQILEDQATA